MSAPGLSLLHRSRRLGRLRGPSLFPFTYETDPEAIRLVLADYDRALQLERRCLAWALKHGRVRAARQSRAFIDQVELRRRNGEARLRSLAPATVRNLAASPDAFYDDGCRHRQAQPLRHPFPGGNPGA